MYLSIESKSRVNAVNKKASSQKFENYEVLFFQVCTVPLKMKPTSH